MRSFSSAPIFKQAPLALCSALLTPFAAAQLGPPEVLVGAEGLSTSWLADLTGDGVLDVVARRRNKPRTVYLGIGSGAGLSFGPLTAIGLHSSGEVETLRTGDFDGDGNLDVLVNLGTRVDIIYQAPTGSFLTPAPVFSGQLGAVEALDLDQDGDLDIVAGGSGNQQDRVLTNLGGGLFTPNLLGGTTALATISLGFADFDSDGDPDILRGSIDGSFVHVNQGGLAFTETPAIPNDWFHAGSGDINGDGLIDVVVAGGFFGPVAWAPNLGGGSFGPSQTIAFSEPTLSAPRVLDVDRDGAMDVVVCSDLNRELLWFPGNGSGGFGAPIVAPLAFSEAVLAQVVDVDGDTDRDLIVLSQSSSGSTLGVQLYETEALAGATYCDAVPNSTGAAGTMSARGSQRASENRLTLEAGQLPQDSFGMFLVSMTAGFTPMSGSSLGNLCLDSTLGRFDRASEVQSSGAEGFIDLTIDLADIPSAVGSASIGAGETWYFQLWHRDRVGGTQVSNFTNGLRVQFR